MKRSLVWILAALLLTGVLPSCSPSDEQKPETTPRRNCSTCGD